ncbi:MAG TPA: DUF4403 family protein [Flavobacterium sp.]|nr:DUF4403 family protein [Flavobacterium sp.]
MSIFTRFTGILFFFLAVGCSTSQKIASLKPEPDDAAPLVYENTFSFIKLPVSMKLKDIENQTNKFLTGLIYEDNNITDDDIEMKIWKLAPISISNENGKIKTILPLKALVKYRIGTSKLGIALYDTREFNLNGKVTLLSDVGLTNWKMSSATELKSLDWTESPTTNVMGKAVPITYIINPAIRIFRSKIEKSIDGAISESMDFKPAVLDALQKVCEPFQMSEAYQSWLRIVPAELYTTNASLKKDIIAMDMGLKCQIETIVGQKPATKFSRDKMVLKPVAKMPDHITANIAAVSTYADASKIITQNFAGQEFASGSKKVKVGNVALWHKSGKMVIALDLTGSINGTIYLTGYPQYNQQTKEIFFDQLDYAVDTKSKLMRTANWLASGYILNKIQQSCRYSIEPNLQEGKQNMMQYLKNYSPMAGVFINGKIEDLHFEKIQLTNKAIIAFLKVNGDVDIKIDGLQ